MYQSLNNCSSNPFTFMNKIIHKKMLHSYELLVFGLLSLLLLLLKPTFTIAQINPLPNSGLAPKLSSLSTVDQTRLLVKVRSGMRPPLSIYASSSNHLFGRYVVYQTQNLGALVQDLQNDPAVESVQYNYKWKNNNWPKLSPIFPKNKSLVGSPTEPSPFNDPMSGQLWGLTGSEQGVNLYKHLLYVKQNHIQKSPVIVAVVDTGVDITHEDLQGKIWVNKNEIPGNKIDDDNNGYVDDVNGIDTLARDAQGHATAHTHDGHGHGTHVSGTIAAVQNNGIGISGISSEAIIMPIRTVPADGDETDIDVAESFLYASKMGARIISCSFGKTAQETPGVVEDAIDEIGKKTQTLVIAAAGNDGVDIDRNLHFPASLKNETLLVVAAIKKGGSITYFSNFGAKSVDVAAPGAAILSLNPGNRYASWDGTSMATPHVSGVAAEILSIYPKLTALQLKEILMKSTRAQSTLSGITISGGIVDVDKARQLAATYAQKRNKFQNTQTMNNPGRFQGGRF